MSERPGNGRRVTINDIARQAGVSKGAVSYALNDRPGLSDETRERILRIADELGWHPNRAARSLSARARTRAVSCWRVRHGRSPSRRSSPSSSPASSPSSRSRSIALTLQLASDLESEIAVYRRWWAERRVDGVLVIDLRVDDPRVDALVELGLPAVVVGGPLESGALPAVWHDEERR